MNASFGGPRTVYSVRNWSGMVTVRIIYTSGRYSVTMRCDDSGTTLPVARVYSRFTDALAYAGSIVA